MDDRAWRRRFAAGDVDVRFPSARARAPLPVVPAGLLERMLHEPEIRLDVVARVWAELAARSLPPPAPLLAGRMVDTLLAERLVAREVVA
jgi:hypothetical protein